MGGKKTLLWAPRIISIIFILFISLFALDIFTEGYSFLELIVGLFMHLIPTFVLIGLTVLAWKKEKIGGIAFLILAVGFTVFFNTYRELITFLLISGPVFLVGILYLLNSYFTRT